MKRLPLFAKAHHFLRSNNIIPSTPAPYIYNSAASRRKIIVIMGPTGCGKTKLSIDLASRFLTGAEIINADKIQVYKGLDITTNKLPLPDRRNILHHLLGEFAPSESHPVFTAGDFRALGSAAVDRIFSRKGIPLIVGGSNSFLYALLAKRFDAGIDIFGDLETEFCRELKYSCCFLWVDVSLPVLNQYLDKRVDEMLQVGMLDELEDYFRNKNKWSSKCGLEMAIGVGEFRDYFRFRGLKGKNYEEAVRAIKLNTSELAKRQLGKILRLRDAVGWELNRVEATTTLAAAIAGQKTKAAEIWETQVLEPSEKIVNEFLKE